MTQSVVVQVGQCGNQIGCRFWDLALREHAAINKEGFFDEPYSSFFRNVDNRYEDPLDVEVGNGRTKIKTLKARAVLVDMEEGVVNELLNSPLRDIFDHKQLITDVSGSGNNWSIGHLFYGNQYRDKLVEVLRRAAEKCDYLQTFFMIHSMGGGTGSGVGTAILNILQDDYPNVYRFVTAVYPSIEDDVITSPYNSILAMKELTDNADCVMPIDNQSLIDICNRISNVTATASRGISKKQIKSESTITNSHGGKTKSSQARPFDGMNNIVANLLLNMTSSSRFEGSLNVDLNEITMNLVPFPRLHYLISSMTPLYALADVNLSTRRLDEMFSDAFSKDYQLIKADPKRNLYLSCALLVRGKVEISDIRRNIKRIRPSLNFIHWNEDGWKTGLCSVPPVGHPYSLLTLSNNTCIKDTFSDIQHRFVKLYKRKAHLHHYLEVDGMEMATFDNSIESLNSLLDEYKLLDQTTRELVASPPRLKVV
ncbi:Tubulin epsilon chain [Trichoplax sp. H2]|nr:Tubulin epsilon chain [Trichoplax sp. H2]|eukprot:RDD38371.1 Tubulin epsilon chain [Trichoplax sp. H2]